jgi:hypothetical protein
MIIKKMRIVRQENEKFIQHWKRNAFIEKRSDVKIKFRKRKKAPKNFVFSSDLRTSFPSIEMM